MCTEDNIPPPSTPPEQQTITYEQSIKNLKDHHNTCLSLEDEPFDLHPQTAELREILHADISKTKQEIKTPWKILKDYIPKMKNYEKLAEDFRWNNMSKYVVIVGITMGIVRMLRSMKMLGLMHEDFVYVMEQWYITSYTKCILDEVMGNGWNLGLEHGSRYVEFVDPEEKGEEE